MAKIVLGRATGVLPPLMYVIDRIMKKHPDYEFEASNFIERQEVDKPKELWARSVDVYSGPDHLGGVSFGIYQGKENKDGEHPEAFGIFSHKVQKQRGDRGTIITADPAAAVRHALKVLGKKSTAHLAEDLRSDVLNGLNGISYRHTYALREMVNYNNDEVTVNFVEHKLFGAPLTLPKTFRFREENKGAYEGWLAAKQMAAAVEDSRATRGYAVEFLRDESIRVLDVEKHRLAKTSKELDKEDADYLVRYKSFDDLPKYLQDRIAVLKIAEHKDPIFNTGVRTTEKNEPLYKFYIVSEADIARHPYEDTTTI